MATLGPTFGQECIDAGLGGLPFMWTADGVGDRDQLTAGQNTTLDEVIAEHDPTLAAVPPTVSRRQFYQALAELGYISQDEALLAMSNPGAYVQRSLLPLLKTIPSEEQFAAQMALLGSQVVSRHDSLFEEYMIISLAADPKAVDDLFRHAATL